MLQFSFNESFFQNGSVMYPNLSDFESLDYKTEGTSTTPLTMYERCHWSKENAEGTSTTPLTMYERYHWSKENAEGIDISPDYKFKKDPCNEEYAVVKHQRSESYFIYYNKSDKKRKMA